MCRATSQTRAVVAGVEKKRPSAVMAGIVPDQRHLSSGGYHVCLVHLREHGRLGDYSSSRPLDRTPKVTPDGAGNSCAYDIGMSRADMIKTHASVRKVWLDHADPRRPFINAINCWDGSAPHPVRYNFQQNSSERATDDHKTHVHGDAPRFYVDVHRSPDQAAKAARAHISVLTGESKAAWLAREDPTAAKPAGKPTTWAIRPGDTLGKISNKTGVSVASLQKWNGLGTSTVIYAGKTLRLTPPPVPRPAVPKWPVGSASYFRPSDHPLKYVVVTQWQQVMHDHGWPITVDGYLGPKSGATLVAFQRAEGLKVTKVLDLATFTRAFTTKKRGK